jgi:hypothetical protein
MKTVKEKLNKDIENLKVKKKIKQKCWEQKAP